MDVAATPASTTPAPDGTSAGPVAGRSIAQNFGVTNPDIARSLPAFVQIPDGSRVQMHMPFSSDRRKGGILMALTPLPQAEVVAFHRRLMDRNGLVSQPDTTGAKGEIILVARNEDATSEYRVSVFPPKESDGTLFSVNYFEPNN